MKALLSYPTVRARLSQMATGSLTSIQNLRQERVLDLPIALPPFDAHPAHIEDLALLERAEQAQGEQAAQLDTLLGMLLRAIFAPAPAGAVTISIKRALFHELSPLHQAIWLLLVNADDYAALSMSELNGRLSTAMMKAPGVDALRRALELLTAAGAATEQQDGHLRRWSEALPYDQDEAP
jgi:hypothetical protein